MDFKRQPLLFLFLFFFIFKLSAQKIVDDSTKTLYGTSTTDIFDQDIVYREQRIFFNKDTFQFKTVAKPSIKFNYNYQRPTLYTKIELEQLKKAEIALQKSKDSAAIAAKREIYYSDSIPKEKRKPNRIFTFIDTLKKKVETKNPRFYKNRYQYYKSDTILDKLQHYNSIFIKDNIYQNLGVLGTPSQAVYPVLNFDLGYNTGFNMFNLYYTPQNKVKYYNSKAPFTSIYYVGEPGASNEDRIKLDVNRNVTRNWNIGLSYERLDTRKQIGLSTIQNRGLMLGQEFLIYTSTRSRDDRYHFMGNFSYFAYRVNEQGGYKPNYTDPSGANLTLSENENPAAFQSWPVWLNAPKSNLNPYLTKDNIFSRDRRVGYHFYHQYDALKQGRLVFFHEFDRKNQKYTFGDPTIKSFRTDSTFYKGKNINRDSASMNDSTYFNQEFEFITNKIGAKHRISNFTIIYYAKFRSGNTSKALDQIYYQTIFSNSNDNFNSFFINNPKGNLSFQEQYIGGEINYKIKDSSNLFFKFEQLLYSKSIFNQNYFGNEFRNRNDYYFTTGLNFKNYFGITFSSLRKSPFMNQLNSFNHNHYQWNNNFTPTLTQNLNIYFNKNIKNSILKTSLNLNQLDQYIYYTDIPTQSNPNIHFRAEQNNGSLRYATLDLTYNFKLWKVCFDNYIKYTYILPNQNDVLRMPTIFYNSRLYFQHIPKNIKLKQEFRFGFDSYFRSAYYGDAYMPSYGQFYVQNEFKLDNLVFIDLFIVAKIRNAKIFLKINQFNKLINLSKGGYITPYYPAPNANFAFGVNWLLFD